MFNLRGWHAGSGAAATIADHIAPLSMPVSPVFKALLLPLCSALAACSSFDGASNRMANIVTPYKIDVVQGNVITHEQIELLRPGLPRQSVRDLLLSLIHISEPTRPY